MLRACHHTRALHSEDRLICSFAGQEGVCAKALPIAAALFSRSQRPSPEHLDWGARAMGHTCASLPKFIMGPSATLTPLPLCSMPIAAPRFRMRLLCQVAALTPAGKTVAKSVSRTPRGESWGKRMRMRGQPVIAGTKKRCYALPNRDLARRPIHCTGLAECCRHSVRSPSRHQLRC